MQDTEPGNSSSRRHPASLETEKLLQVCDKRYQKRSGPGGQHRNKVETGVFLCHRPTGVQAEATERRSKQENQRLAVKRLRVNLALQVRLPHTVNTPVSDRWKQRCHNGRLQISIRHEQFPALLAEMLDVIQAAEYDLPLAAKQLGISSSQLVKALKLEPRALRQVNENRQNRGLRPWQ